MPTVAMKRPRGLAINNPLNIKWSAKNKWQGADPTKRDGALEAFVSPQMGVRAAGRVLLKYKTDGLDTVSEIITKWAPPDPTGDKNPTASYIAFVAGRLGVESNQPIEIDDCATALKLVKAMGRDEQGMELPWTDGVILEGLKAAGIHNVPPAPVMKTPEGKSAVVISTTGILGLAIQANDVVQQTTMNMPWLGDVARFMIANQPKLVGVLIVAAIIAGGYAIWARRKKQAQGLT